MKTYDLIKQLLERDPSLRDSDRRLIWEVWKLQGLADKNYITYDNFMKAESPETIRRTRQKLQETKSYLRSNESVQRAKKVKESSKGTFIFREHTPVLDNATNTAWFN